MNTEIENPGLPHDNIGNNITMPQSTFINDKANNSLSSTQIKDKTGYFTVTKRAGSFLNTDSVYELYATPPVGTSAGKFIYLGTNGQHTNMNVGYIEITANVDKTKPFQDPVSINGSKRESNGVINIALAFNNINPPTIGFNLSDARIAFSDSTKVGTVALIQGSGADGAAVLQMAEANTPYVEVTATSIHIGGTITPDASTYTIGTSSTGISKYYLNGGIFWTSGSGSPNSSVTAPVGSIYSRSDGAVGSTIYIKETGSGNTGWDAVGSSTNSGAIVFWPISGAPSWGIIADGSTVSRTTYSGIFAAYGTTYGVGNGTTTFGLPDMRGFAPVGFKSGDANFGTIGTTVGEVSHTLISGELPAHAHKMGTRGIGYTTENNGGTSTGTQGVGVGTVAGASLFENTQLSTGGGGAHNNIQPSFPGNWIITI